MQKNNENGNVIKANTIDNIVNKFAQSPWPLSGEGSDYSKEEENNDNNYRRGSSNLGLKR